MALRILITNDDGVDAPGIAVMRSIAAQLSDDVWVVAPEANQSGAGHRFTFGRELELDEREHQVFAIPGGSPADCIVAGMTRLLVDQPPNLVLSGVNAGQNLGDIINCSGTAAGAREGAMQGALAIAMSQAVNYAHGHDVDWRNAERYGVAAVRAILAATTGPDTYYNVNFPHCPPEQVKGIEAVSHQRFARSPFRSYQSDNAGKFFVAIPETPKPLDPQGDFAMLNTSHVITVTPLSLQQTDMTALARMKGTLAL